MQADREKFDRITAEHEDFSEALDGGPRTPRSSSRSTRCCATACSSPSRRSSALHRTSPREEEARQLARSHMRDLEFAWATFLTRGMEQGVIPQADPRLLARAILGLYNSVWHWYRPRGRLTLDDVRDFYVERCLAVAGLPVGLTAAPDKEARREAQGRAQGGLSVGSARAGHAARTRRPAGLAPDGQRAALRLREGTLAVRQRRDDPVKPAVGGLCPGPS